MVPEESQVMSMADFLNKNGISNLNLLSRRTPKTEKREVFEAVSSTTIGPIIGTQQICLFPFRSLGLLVISNEHSQLYKRKSMNFSMNFKDMALKLGTDKNADIIPYE